MLGPLDVHQDLPLKHDEGLVLVRVGVKRRRLAFDIRSSNRMNAPSVSSAVAFMVHTPPPANQRRSPLLPSDDRYRSAHTSLLLSRAFGTLA
jgi:hypothetical protein